MFFTASLLVKYVFLWLANPVRSITILPITLTCIISMKRILFTVFVFLVATGIYGCGGGGGTSEGSGEWREVTGVVKPLGVTIYQEGTHRLEKDNVLLLILESRKFALAQFEEAEVTVSGVVRDTKQGGQKIMDVEDLNVLVAADERVKRTYTYISPIVPFRFEYPPVWPKYEDFENGVRFSHEGKTKPFFSVTTEAIGDGFVEWLKTLSFEGYSLDAETLMRVDGKNATRRIYRSDDNQIISVSLPFEGRVYHFLFDGRWTLDLQAEKAAFYNLIDSFVFSAQTGDSSTGASTETTNATTANTEKPQEPTTENPVSATTGGAEVTTPDVAASGFLTSEEITKTIEKGFTTFTSSSLKFSIDIPKSWYYSGFSGVTGAIYRYGFTDYKTYQDSGDDINLGNLIASLDIVTGSLNEVKRGVLSKFGDNAVYVYSSDQNIHMYVTRDDVTTFVLKGSKTLQPILEKMAGSLKVQ